jgi:DNA repair exonuclease SbcCD ATPase subunit
MHKCPDCGKPVQGSEDYRVTLTLTHKKCLDQAAVEAKQRSLTKTREQAARNREKAKYRGPRPLPPSKRD